MCASVTDSSETLLPVCEGGSLASRMIIRREKERTASLSQESGEDETEEAERHRRCRRERDRQAD